MKIAAPLKRGLAMNRPKPIRSLFRDENRGSIEARYLRRGDQRQHPCYSAMKIAAPLKRLAR